MKKFIAIAAVSAAFQVPAAPLFHFTELSDTTYFSELLRVNQDGSPRLANFSQYSGGVLYVSDVNSSGGVAGTCGGPFGMSFYACTYSPSNGFHEVPFLRPPNTTSQAYATASYDINENGDVLGGATNVNTGNNSIGLQVLKSTGELVDFGIGSYRRPSFNNAMTVVGGGLPENTAFYFDGTSVNLSTLVVDLGGFLILTPTDINDAGYIAGYGRNAAGQARGFILSPINQVPEPASVILMLAGLTAVATVVRRQKRSSKIAPRV